MVIFLWPIILKLLDQIPHQKQLCEGVEASRLYQCATHCSVNYHFPECFRVGTIDYLILLHKPSLSLLLPPLPLSLSFFLPPDLRRSSGSVSQPIPSTEDLHSRLHRRVHLPEHVRTPSPHVSHVISTTSHVTPGDAPDLQCRTRRTSRCGTGTLTSAS